MPEQPQQREEPEVTKRRSSPQTDPTNPFRQETNGEWTQNEQIEQREEPGLTEDERQRRGQGD